MKNRISIILLVLLGIGAFGIYNAIFFVDEREQAIVLQFGEFKQAYTDPGMKFKVPFIQDVVYYPKRALPVDPSPQQAILADQKRIDVDSYAYYRITDPLQFFRVLNNVQTANSRIGDRVNSTIREALGRYTLASMLSPERLKLISDVRTSLNKDLADQGVELLDVQIRRADLPAQTSAAIFARMISEREREAKEFRAQGDKLRQEIQSRADRQRTVLLSEAEKEAQELRGKGDAEAISIYAEAFNVDPDFYAFYRSMEAYRNSLTGDGTTMVLSPNSDFFRYFGNIKGD